jgi:penicillin-insensitive murein DD-endopeptidase
MVFDISETQPRPRDSNDRLSDITRIAPSRDSATRSPIVIRASVVTTVPLRARLGAALEGDTLELVATAAV